MDSLRAFFDRWYPRLVRYIEGRVGDRDHAEDLAQEVFVRLLRCQPRDPEAWIFAVAANLASDHARVTGGRARRLALLADELRHESDDVGEPGPELLLLRAEEGERVRRALAALPERDRVLLLLHRDGFRYREIARELGTAASSIGSLLTRAQRRFARSYDNAGPRVDASGTRPDDERDHRDERRASH